NRGTDVSGKAFVWFSQDHGATWNVSDPWAGQTSTMLAKDLAAGNSGAVYVCGTVTGPQWTVRKGVKNLSGDITWTTVDSISGQQPNAIAVRPGPVSQNDYIVVCGQSSMSNWTVRRSADGGATWTTIDTNGGGTASSVAVGANGDLYVDG